MALKRLPRQLLLTCPACGEEDVRHQVLKGRMKSKGEGFTMDVLVKCGECGDTRHEIIRRAEPMKKVMVVSDGNSSHRAELWLEEDEAVGVDDVVELEEYPVRITAVEGGGRRVKMATAPKITGLWAVRFDRVIIKCSVVEGRETTAVKLEAGVYDEFTAGQPLKVEGTDHILTKIKTREKVLIEGSALAHEVQRLYLKPKPRPMDLWRDRRREDKHRYGHRRDSEGRIIKVGPKGGSKGGSGARQRGGSGGGSRGGTRDGPRGGSRGGSRERSGGGTGGRPGSDRRRGGKKRPGGGR